MGSNFTIMFENSIAVIVAGGQSSRMEEDKALLPFGDFSSLAEYQYRRLEKIFSKVYLSVKEDKFDFSVELIKDIDKESSPLVALVSIFETLKYDEIFVLSVDAPFVEKNIIEQLYSVSRDNLDVVVAESKIGIEPLCAIYRRSCLIYARKLLANNQHRLQSFFNELRIEKVLIDSEYSFINLNYPEDYKKAKLLIEKK